MYTIRIETARGRDPGRDETEVFRVKLRAGQQASKGARGKDEYYDGHYDDNQNHQCLGEDRAYPFSRTPKTPKTLQSPRLAQLASGNSRTNGDRNAMINTAVFGAIQNSSADIRQPPFIDRGWPAPTGDTQAGRSSGNP